MRKIRYNTAANDLYFEYPIGWDGELVTAVTLTIRDRDGVDALAATSVTLFTQTAIESAVVAFADSMVLPNTTDSLDAGNPVLVCGASGNERLRVKEYDEAVYTPTMESSFRYAHDAAEKVWGLFGNITVDTSAVATFPAGEIFTLLWTPTGSGEPITEYVQVVNSALDIESLDRRFERLYPRAYDSFSEPTDRLADMAELAEVSIREECLASNPPFDIDRLVGQDAVSLTIMAEMARMWALSGDENLKDEFDKVSAEKAKWLATLKAKAKWLDDDQDGVEDEDEISSHAPTFQRSW
ncbi:MAG: hypothetical protein GY847_28880 [Proteobacteria bacterium]|nr:hypothetical protein [Pseudomonadota bacterium]